MVEHRGATYTGEHASIVELPMWQQVNDELRAGRRTATGAIRAPQNALLADLLICKSCQRPMVPTYTAKRGRRYRYYVCQTVRRKGWSSCPSKSVPARMIEDAVLEQLRAALCAPETRERLNVSEADWQAFEERHREVVRAMVKEVSYDGPTGAVSLDLTGAVVPDVQVTATQTDTDIKRAVVTDAAGDYVLTNLPLGPYRLEASKMGFRTYVQTGIELQVNSKPEIAITLAVGQVTESVQVEANATQVETRSVGVGTVVETQRIVDLPLNGRDPTQLITLSGAAVQGAANPSYEHANRVSDSRWPAETLHGVQYNFDGANYINPFDGTGMLLPFPDALQEFKLSTSAQDASNSGRGGAAVNAVTKSGTNSFHGDAFEFIRNYDVNARDFFAATARTA